MAPLKHPVHHRIIVLRGLRGAVVISPLCQETLVSRTAAVSFFNLDVICTQRNIFEILLNQAAIRLYVPFPDWLGSKRTSVWFQINRKMENTIWFRIDSIRKISLCVATSPSGCHFSSSSNPDPHTSRHNGCQIQRDKLKPFGTDLCNDSYGESIVDSL